MNHLYRYLPVHLNERTTSAANGQGTTTRTSLLSLLREIVSKSECRSCNEGVINYTRTSAMLTGMTTTEALLLSKALGRIRCSYRKKSIINDTHASAVLTVTTTSSATAPTRRIWLSLCCICLIICRSRHSVLLYGRTSFLENVWMTCNFLHVQI